MRLQVTNILLKYGEDPDTFATRIPEDYMPRSVTRRDVENIEEAILLKKPEAYDLFSFRGWKRKDKDDCDQWDTLKKMKMVCYPDIKDI